MNTIIYNNYIRIELRTNLQACGVHVLTMYVSSCICVHEGMLGEISQIHAVLVLLDGISHPSLGSMHAVLPLPAGWKV